ncbi:MAG: flagellar basal-body rod protein FlgF [Geminicoccaceae bacterium]|nr:flagellar basal-body rod protein FlgF [Geminicoccaceae bacterium]
MADLDAQRATPSGPTMDTTAYIALSRQIALQEKMTATASNIANMATTGFKALHTAFRAQEQERGDVRPADFVRERVLVRDLRVGPLETTDNPFDLAIGGEGYFAVETPEGPAYTRDGHFALDPLGQLVNASGDLVLDDGGAPVVLPPNSGAVTIAADGTITTRTGPAGRLQLVTFADPQRLQAIGSSLYRSDQPPEPVLEPHVLQGRLEGSNVNPVMEMTTMMETVRAFQTTQKMIEAHHDLARRAVEQMLAADA